ncbi:hypothetical protein [Kistimonas asteriae]|uniref:hypothetical protein n=1 Tax=Kistimonas asteriae TaxID=517724 RepID=UPI001BA78D79|nr:hypothetical protein [Kistimonas asteriae]
MYLLNNETEGGKVKTKSFEMNSFERELVLKSLEISLVNLKDNIKTCKTALTYPTDCGFVKDAAVSLPKYEKDLECVESLIKRFSFWGD